MKDFSQTLNNFIKILAQSIIYNIQMKNKKTSPTKPVKHPSNQNETIQTKSKLLENPIKMKLSENDKPTLSTKNHKIAIQLKTKSAAISEEESK